MILPLVGVYAQVATVHGFTGLVSKVSLLVLLAAIAGGNKRPGQALLTGTFALHFFIACAVLFSLKEEADDAPILPVAVLCLTMALATGLQLLKPEGEWRLGHAVPWKKYIGIALIAWAFWYPVFSRNLLTAFFFSPLGALPHPSLIVACVIAWWSVPDTPRLAGWTFAIGACVLGIIDVAVGKAMSSIILLVTGGMLAWELVRGVAQSGGVLEDDVPRVDKVEKLKIRDKVETKEGRTWKLK